MFQRRGRTSSAGFRLNSARKLKEQMDDRREGSSPIISVVKLTRSLISDIASDCAMALV